MPNKASSSSGSRHNKVYVLQRAHGDDMGGGGAPQVALVGVYVSEEQAYAAVIQRQVAGMELMAGSMLSELRKIVTVKGLSFKERYKKMADWIRDCDWLRQQQSRDPEFASFQIKECPLVPFEKVNESKLFSASLDFQHQHQQHHQQQQQHQQQLQFQQQQQQQFSDNGCSFDEEDDDEVFDDSGLAKAGFKKRRFGAPF